MDVQDVPEPFQNAACFELVKQSACMIDLGRILGANWEGFGGLWLRHEPRSVSLKRCQASFELPGSLKYHFGTFCKPISTSLD